MYVLSGIILSVTRLLLHWVWKIYGNEKNFELSPYKCSMLAKQRAKRGARFHSSTNCLLHIGSGTCKNSELPSRHWHLEKFRFHPLYIGSGTWENSELSPRLWDWESSELSCSLKHRPQAKWRHEKWSSSFGLANKLSSALEPERRREDFEGEVFTYDWWRKKEIHLDSLYSSRWKNILKWEKLFEFSWLFYWFVRWTRNCITAQLQFENKAIWVVLFVRVTDHILNLCRKLLDPFALS